MAKVVNESAVLGAQIKEGIVETNKNIVKQTSIVNTICERTEQVHQTVGRVAQVNQQISARMSRIEGISASSQTSIEEVKGKIVSFLSNINGKGLEFVKLSKRKDEIWMTNLRTFAHGLTQLSIMKTTTNAI